MFEKVFLLQNFSVTLTCIVIVLEEACKECSVFQTWSWIPFFFKGCTVLWNILRKELNYCSRKDLILLFQNLHIAQFHGRHLLLLIKWMRLMNRGLKGWIFGVGRNQALLRAKRRREIAYSTCIAFSDPSTSSKLIRPCCLFCLLSWGLFLQFIPIK